MLIATMLLTDLYNNVSLEMVPQSSSVFPFKSLGMSEIWLWHLISLLTNLAALL